jgi:zinc transport system substrate-binding protein
MIRRARLPVGLLLAVLLLTAGTPASSAEATPKVVATMKLLHALVAGVMAGVAEPLLLLDGTDSPHTHALRPSEVAALEAADRVFWMGPPLEGFMVRAVVPLEPGRAVALGERLGALILPLRLAPEDDGDDDEHGHEPENQSRESEEGHAHVDAGGRPLPDLHALLDPTIAAAAVALIASELAEADPASAARYRANADDLLGRLAALDAELAGTLAPVRERSFAVFHDAFQYLERRYGLRRPLAIALNPEEAAPGARHLSHLRAEIRDGTIVCVFAEPQFEPRLVTRLIEGTAARTGTLDPDGGAGLAPGPEAYFVALRRLAATLAACLSG